MKLLNRLTLFLIVLNSALAFGTEVLVCHVGISHPNAENLKLKSLTEGVRLVSEKYTPKENRDGWNNKNFEVALSEKGNREFAFTLHDHEPTSRAPLNVSLLIDTFYGDESLETMEFNVNIASLLNIENKEYRHSHIGEMLCIRNPDQRCIGNLGSNLYNWPSKPETYFSYSVYCRPM
jgi:hypothetical protein